MTLLLSFIIGILVWPLLEYLLHRLLGHVFKMSTLFKKEHTRHHAETNYFAPKRYKVYAAIAVCTFTFLVISFLTRSFAIASAYSFGFVGMYCFYEWFHWSIHTYAPRTKLGLKLRKHHLTHHFHNPKMNHGVTSTIIDKITGTYLYVDVVKVPKNIALPWLFEPGKETIDPQFSKDFQLR